MLRDVKNIFFFLPDPSVRQQISQRVEPAGGHAYAGVARVLGAQIRQIRIRVLFFGDGHRVVPAIAARVYLLSFLYLLNTSMRIR